MKPCRKCGSEERYATGDCKACARRRALQYQSSNRERCNKRKAAWRRAYYRNNPEAAKSKYQSDKAKYGETIRLAQERYRSSHPEYWREWARRNRSQNRERYRRWREANPELAKEATRRWREMNPDRVRNMAQRRRARKAGAKGDSSSAQDIQRFLYYGGVCWICRCRPARVMDHVIALCNGGTNWPSNLRPACVRCNSSKGPWESRAKRSVSEIMAWVLTKRDFGFKRPR